MTLTDEDIQEFITLARMDGVELTHEAATETATRLILLYLRLALPTPSERLANSGEQGNLTTNKLADPASF
jgi:hypothetical protein